MTIDTIVLAHAGEVHTPDLLTSAGIAILLVLGSFLVTRGRDAFDTLPDGGRGDEREDAVDSNIVPSPGPAIRGVSDPADPVRSR